MRSLSIQILISLFISGIALAGAASTRPSKLLLGTFASQCPQVVTNDVSSSLGTLQSLYGIIDELKNDKDCTGAAQLANALARYGSLYSDFQTQSSESLDSLALEKKIAMYSNLLSNSSLNSSQVDFLNTEIFQSQSELVNVKVGLTRFQNFSGNEARGANQVVLAVDNFLTNLSQDQKSTCYKKHGSLISSLISNALLVTSSFASPGASLALASGGVIVSSLESYIESFKYNKKLNQVGDIEMPIALRCISEVLTNQYCDADKTKALILDRLNSSTTPKARYEGIALLSYQLPSLSTWLDEVYSGSEITSQGDLINREKPIIQSEFLKKVKRYVETFGTIKKKTFENITNLQDRSTAIAKAIQGLAFIMDNPTLTPRAFTNNTEFENPIFISNSQPLMPFTLWSPGTLKAPPTCDNVTCTLEIYLAKNNITLDMNNWSQSLLNASKIIQETIDRVNIDRSKTVSVDTYSIMVNAKRDLKGQVNPYTALQKIIANVDRIINYLSELGCKNSPLHCEDTQNIYFPQIINIRNTKALTANVIQLIDESSIPRTIPQDSLPVECRDDKNSPEVNQDDNGNIFEIKSFKITSCISKLLKLVERGTDVYFSKIRNMVSYEMEARLKYNDLGNGLEDIVTATKGDLLQSILTSYASKDSRISIDDLKTGLETAQYDSKESLKIFFDFFKDDILIALKNNNIPEGPKADLCFRILPYLDENDQPLLKEAYNSCKLAQKKSYIDGPKILFSNFVQKVTKKGLFKRTRYSLKNQIDERAKFCSYSDYHNASLLYDEQIRVKTKNESQNYK